MATAASADSRQYRFGFMIASPAEYPADFPVVTPKGFRAALFLPRDEAGRLGRWSYPPRILTLSRDALEIRAHPTAKERPVRVPMAELQFTESGHILLHGWLRFSGAQTDRTVVYNTRSSPSVDRFMAEFRDLFTPPDPAAIPANPTCSGKPPDLKFRNALLRELAPDERIRIQLFSPATRTRQHWGILRYESWRPGDLLAVTDRRLL